MVGGSVVCSVVVVPFAVEYDAVVVVTIPETFLPAFHSRSEFGFPEIPTSLAQSGWMSHREH